MQRGCASKAICTSSGSRRRGKGLHPQPIEDVTLGLAVSVVASLINLAVGFLLLRAGRRERSIVLEADG